jgi:enoyl-CoA hydratase
MSKGNANEDKLVTYHREGYVGFITLNRPEKHNALNRAVWDVLNEAIGMAEEEEDARVVLLRGEGKSFCAGLDLGPDNELMSAIGGTPGAAQKVRNFKMIRRIQDIHTRLEHLPAPTIAVIHGHCLGAGMELALCCDFRLCSAGTIFSLPESRLAIITDLGGLQRLPRVVGPGHAREIAFRGHRFDAEQARAINLVNDVYLDKETLEEKAIEIAGEIADNPPLAVQGTKEVFLFQEEGNLNQFLNYNAARTGMILPSEDLLEAVSAYFEKRKGKFKGD